MNNLYIEYYLENYTTVDGRNHAPPGMKGTL